MSNDPQTIPHWWSEIFGEHWAPQAWTLSACSLALIVGFIGGQLALGAASRWARHTDTVIDDAVLKHLRRPLRALFPLTALTLTLPFATVGEQSRPGLHHFLVVGLILTLGWVFFRGVRVVEEVVEHRYDIRATDNLRARAIRTQVRGVRNIAGFVIAVLTFGFALLSFDTVRQVGAGLLASAGVAGIIIGFAAQRSIATILAGLQIAISQPIRVDDVVIVEGEWGRIEEITLSYVVVRIWDLRRLIVPINYFIEKPFQNWTRTSADLLGTVELHVDYTVDVEALRTELQRVVSESPHWDKKVCGLQVTASNERSMVVRPLMSAKDASAAWDLRCEVREKMIAYLQRQHPQALPRLRGELQGKP